MNLKTVISVTLAFFFPLFASAGEFSMSDEMKSSINQSSLGSNTKNNRRSFNEDSIEVNRGATNPRNGRYYAPAGSNVVDTVNGTVYLKAGPSTYIDTRTGQPRQLIGN